MSSSSTVADLRRLLAARFPSATRRSGGVVPTGVPAIDEALGGGLPGGAFTEITGEQPGCGQGVALVSLLESTRRERQRVALIDAGDSFAPDEIPPPLLEHLVWARPADLKQTWAVADLFFRDSHFAVVILDFRDVPERTLRRVQGPTWYRLQRAVEQSGAAALALTPAPLVPCARDRFSLVDRLTLRALKAERSVLARELAPVSLRQLQGRERSA